MKKIKYTRKKAIYFFGALTAFLMKSGISFASYAQPMYGVPPDLVNNSNSLQETTLKSKIFSTILSPLSLFIILTISFTIGLVIFIKKRIK